MTRRKSSAPNTGFDSVFEYVREFGGRYQLSLYFGSCLLIVPIGMQIACLVFAMGTPHFHCADMNSTCTPNKCCDNCTSGYIFDGPFTSIVSDWNLICGRAHLAAIAQAVFMVGMLVGSIVFGTTSDTFGRKKTIFFTCVVMVAFAVGSAFADCLSLFAVLRFVVGASATGLMLSQYVFTIELVGPSKRAMGGKLQDFYWVASGSLTALLAYLIRDWNHLILACSLPALLLLLFWRVFPESPRWLALNGRTDDACAVILKFGGKNGETLESETIMNALKETELEEKERTEEETNVFKEVQLEEEEQTKERQTKVFTPLDLLRTKKLRKRTLITCFMWFAISASFYGFVLYVVNLSGNLYLNFFILFLIDLPHTPISWFLIQTFGRRVPFASFLLIGGGTCLLSLAVKDYPKAVLAISMIGKFFCSASFSIVYIYTSELYPTVVRNIAIGTGSMCARIGAITAPFIVMLAQLPNLSVTLPIVIIGIVTVISGILALWLPETLYDNMHQTIEEVEAAQESYKIPCEFPQWKKGFKNVPANDTMLA